MPKLIAVREYTPEEQQILDRLAADIAEGNSAMAAAAIPPEGGRLVGSAGGNWKQPQGRVLTLIPPGEIITQYGTTWFRPMPRFDAPTVQLAISMLRGRHSVQYAARKVTRHGRNPDSSVRYFHSSDLWLSGYTVYHSPSEHNEHHVSVYYGPTDKFEDYEASVASWESPDRVTLDQLAVPAGEVS